MVQKETVPKSARNSNKEDDVIDLNDLNLSSDKDESIGTVNLEKEEKEKMSERNLIGDDSKNLEKEKDAQKQTKTEDVFTQPTQNNLENFLTANPIPRTNQSQIYYDENGLQKNNNINLTNNLTSNNPTTNSISYNNSTNNHTVTTKGPFSIFKSKIEASNKIGGIAHEKNLFFYFLFRNMNVNQREVYKKMYLTYIKSIALPRNTNNYESNLINDETNFNHYSESYTNNYHQSQKRSKIKSKKVLPRRKSSARSIVEDTHFMSEEYSDDIHNLTDIYNAVEIKQKRQLDLSEMPPVIEYVPKKCRPVQKKPRAAVAVALRNKYKRNLNLNNLTLNNEIAQEKNMEKQINSNINTTKSKDLFVNTPFLVWLDSMINQYLKRFSINPDAEKDYFETMAEQKTFQLALNMGKEWQKMSIKEKSEWIKEQKNDVPKSEKNEIEIVRRNEENSNL